MNSLYEYEKPHALVINVSLEYALCQISGDISVGGHDDTYDIDGGDWD